MRQDVLDRARATEPLFDIRGKPRRAALGEQLIDVTAISQIRRHPAGRGMRLPHETQLFQARHDVAQRRRRHFGPAARQPQRRHGFAVIDVGLYEPPENLFISFGQLRMRGHQSLAVNLCDC